MDIKVYSRVQIQGDEMFWPNNVLLYRYVRDIALRLKENRLPLDIRRNIKCSSILSHGIVFELAKGPNGKYRRFINI